MGSNMDALFHHCLDEALGSSVRRSSDPSSHSSSNPTLSPPGTLLSTHPPTIAVAVSGGADSIALAWALAQWARDKPVRVWGVTVDHRMRPESVQEARGVARLFKDWGLRHTTLHLPEFHMPATQERARLARYEHLARFCHRNQIPVLCVGHHRSDQLETWLMRLLRQSGPRGLGGMDTETWMLGIKVVRPFLCLPPDFLKEFLRAWDVGWCEDPSNQNPKYQRVRLRQQLQTLDSDTQDFWNTHIRPLQAMRQTQEATWRGWIRTFAQCHGPDGIALPIPPWQALSVVDQEGVLRIVLEAVGGRKRHPPGLQLLRNLVSRLDGILHKRGATGTGITGGGCVMRRKKIGLGKDVLLFQREHARIRPVFVEAGTSDLMWDGRYYLWFPTPLSDGVWITPRGTRDHQEDGGGQTSASSPVLRGSLSPSSRWLGLHLWRG